MPTTEPSNEKNPPSKTERHGGVWKLWVSVVLAFIVLSAAWYTLIKIASEHKPEEIDVPSQSDPAAQPEQP
ncbi:MAG: hypothetical protein E1N59_1723 [Puniceicoccaceae bacterium 5H]|nr:MAG: hypothetical protein E1N59_1723 [Puniceicoccaceae bacterium 5H]